MNKTRKAAAKTSKPISPEELIARAKKSNDDYHAGRFIDQEKLERD